MYSFVGMVMASLASVGGSVVVGGGGDVLLDRSGDVVVGRGGDVLLDKSGDVVVGRGGNVLVLLCGHSSASVAKKSVL